MPQSIVAEKGTTQKQKQNQQTYYNIIKQVPPGYTVTGIQKVTPNPQTAFDPDKPLEKKGPVTGADYYVATLEKKVNPEYLVYAPDPFFGLEVQYPYDIAPAELKKVAVRVNTYNPENRAVTGLGLATTVGVGVAVPVLGAGALATAGAGEAAKRVITGSDLTVEEAVALAGMGEVITGAGILLGQKYVTPRVQQSVEASYKKSVENFELFKPTTLQKVGMKVTGVKAPRLAQEIVGAGEAKPLSFSNLKSGSFGDMADEYFFDFPTPKSSQVYLAKPVGRARSWAATTLVRQVHLEGLFTTTYPVYLVEYEKPLKASMPHIPTAPAISRAVSVTPVRFVPFSFAVQSVTAFTTQKRVSRVAQKQRLSQAAKAITGQVTSQSQLQRQAQSQSVAQIQREILGTTTTQRQSQTVKQRQTVPTFPEVPTVTIPKTPKLPYLSRGGGDLGSGSFKRFFGSWYPRHHKVKTWEQQLKTFGFLGKAGKVPKSVKRISKANSLGDLGRAAKGLSLVQRKSRKGRRKKR